MFTTKKMQFCIYICNHKIPQDKIFGFKNDDTEYFLSYCRLSIPTSFNFRVSKV